MSPLEAIAGFAVAAGLLTILPGLDTALVLRTAAVEGPRRAALAGLGITLGCLVWGMAVAVGLGALLAASHLAFTILKWAGAAYLLWLGIGMLARPRRSFELGDAAAGPAGGELTWLRRGLLTNLLNPKIGVFYVSFLPQFMAQGVPAGPFLVLLAAIHGLIGLAWFAVLITATRPLARALKRPAVVAWLDRVTGGVFVAFAARLALSRT
ncbi:MAG: lysine transporter LysE [Phenylobacterium sp.]|uniref:LysE family translocator n=1 Tax=Phenylobacterium sp. TaxID=1871053 RepID=UPI0025E981BC|nr:LysE family translocator [Phenylobacterium sp.]MBA4013216.1 lysine transporter LysE [Phenylobacterium sp.]